MAKTPVKLNCRVLSRVSVSAIRARSGLTACAKMENLTKNEEKPRKMPLSVFALPGLNDNHGFSNIPILQHGHAKRVISLSRLAKRDPRATSNCRGLGRAEKLTRILGNGKDIKKSSG